VRRIDSVVIGAGQAGLGVSRELVERGIEHVVLEQGRIGETWRSQRWDAFALNRPAWMNCLPGDAAPARPDDFRQRRRSPSGWSATRSGTGSWCTSG
jgi:putative flavoprotein involved in K+ transport